MTEDGTDSSAPPAPRPLTILSDLSVAFRCLLRIVSYFKSIRSPALRVIVNERSCHRKTLLVFISKRRHGASVFRERDVTVPVAFAGHVGTSRVTPTIDLRFGILLCNGFIKRELVPGGDIT